MIFCLTACSSPAEIIDNCNKRCQSEEHNRGECFQTGSAHMTEEHICVQNGGVEITKQEDSIPGCDFGSIGSWDVCCCFE